MKTRFEILCIDGAWRFVFCRSLNGSDPKTKSAIITTELRGKAFAAYSPEGIADCLTYFTEHSHNRPIRVAA